MNILFIIKRKTKNAFKRLLKFIKHCTHYIIGEKLYKKIYCTKYNLIRQPQDLFKVVYKIKDKTWETNYAPAVYNTVKERAITGFFPAQNIYYCKNAIVCPGSDIVLTEEGAYWDKYIDDDFVTCARPADCNVYTFDDKTVYIKKMKKRICLLGPVFSLVGVWSYHWAHFTYEFLGKLYYAGEAGVFDKEITLLTNDSHDDNIEQIIDEYLLKYPKVKRIKTEQFIEYSCDELYFSPALANNYNEVNFYLEYRFLTPQNTIDIVDKYLVKPLIEKVKERPVKHRKLYLKRNNNRLMGNQKEMEDFFRNEDFYFIECSELSLEEKADLFYHADIIAGLNASSFMNLIFCHDAKCLSLVNNRYSTDLLMCTWSKGKVKTFLNVTGLDANGGRRTNFTIPLEKIKSAYRELLDA